MATVLTYDPYRDDFVEKTETGPPKYDPYRDDFVTEAPLALSVAPSSGPRGRLLIACLAVSVLASVVCREFVWPTLLGQRPPLIWNDFLLALVHYASNVDSSNPTPLEGNPCGSP